VIRRLLLIAALVMAALAVMPAVPAAAHQQKIAISTLSVNPRTGALELVHQVPVHDAEHALRAGGAKTADIVGSEESREAFARYVTRHFLLALDGAAVTPAYVGSEISGGSLMIYQEVAAPARGVQITVNSQILTDVWARQENRVNIGRGAGLVTLLFTADSGPQSATLPR
jgi:hypothetical protein